VLNVGPNHDGSTTVELLGFGDSEIKNWTEVVLF
jgi:hypothetical protein